VRLSFTERVHSAGDLPSPVGDGTQPSRRYVHSPGCHPNWSYNPTQSNPRCLPVVARTVVANEAARREGVSAVDLRELRYFLAVAEELHFGRAAGRLCIAQSALSRALQRTEVSLGVKLFERTRRHVELTAAGIALRERAPGVLSAFEEVQVTAAAASRGEVGTLSVASSPVGRYDVAPVILERFTRDSPHIHVVRREQLASRVVEDLLAGDLDVGVAFCPPYNECLAYEPIKDMELRVLLPNSHPLASRGRVTLDELRDECFVLPAETLAQGYLAGVASVFRDAGFEPRYVTEIFDHDEDLHSVLHEEGVMVSARTFLRNPPGISILGLEPAVALPLVIVRPRGEPSAILAHFLTLAQEVASEQGWGANGH
jgi:DNA-binding transcriptional LysR family regulator